MVDFDTKRFAAGKTLMPGGFTPPEQIKGTGSPATLASAGVIDHAVAGQNLFQINVREKRKPTIKQ